MRRQTLTLITSDIAAAAAALAQGKLVAFPTETVYGLGGNALDEMAVARVFEAKGRPRINPLIVHVAERGDAVRLGVFNGAAHALAEAFWPGPLTLVVPRAENCPVSLLASAGLDSLAIRMPSHDMARRLIATAGVPVVAPSANLSGRVSATTVAHVLEGLAGRIDMVLDGGACEFGIESTVVACLDGPPELLRPGAVSRQRLEEVLGAALRDRSEGGRPVAPGALASHYAPAAALRLGAERVEEGEALLAFGADVPAHAGPTLNLSPAGNLREAAANLFAMLREFDAGGARAIAVMPIPH
ncbi:MAG: L-threonylcarbamoyladenylate synthase, partial [Hyphomicrobiales bacterium]